MKAPFTPRPHRPAPPAPRPLVGLVTRAPAPTTEAPAAAAPMELPPLPLAGARDKPWWPRNEDEIDLPTAPPPAPAAPDLDAPIYLGGIRARLRLDSSPLDLEVRLAVDGTAVEIGPLILEPAHARRLWRLLRIAVAVAGCGAAAPETEARHG